MNCVVFSLPVAEGKALYGNIKCATSKMGKRQLVAFDFDDTLIDANSDVVVQKLSPSPEIPADVRALHSSKGWTEFMGGVFCHLYDHGITASQILECMEEIPLVAGMPELLRSLHESRRCDVIIISDSNSVFIEHILRAASLDLTVNKVYTNPAKFDENGRLTLSGYHVQDWCKLSTINMCKGHILEAHIGAAAELGIQYDRVAYVGDGSNDLCPALRLRPIDIVFPRKGYRLIEKIASLNGDSASTLTAKIVPWDSGLEILTELNLGIASS